MSGLEPAVIEMAYRAACRAELAALKPGNVHVHAEGHGMTVAQFEASAAVTAPIIAVPELRPGEKVLRAVEASLEAADCNTNLGIVLLCVPLAEAAARGNGPLRRDLERVLVGLDRDDAAAVFRAIALANPGGLGDFDQHDVRSVPDAGLVEAMVLAAGRDRIARAYATGFAEIFDVALPVLDTARSHRVAESWVITTLYMTLLAAERDSHVLRKQGPDVAEAIRREAFALAQHWLPVATHESFASLLTFDQDLKLRGINPGTTADLTVATFFAAALKERQVA